MRRQRMEPTEGGPMQAHLTLHGDRVRSEVTDAMKLVLRYEELMATKKQAAGARTVVMPSDPFIDEAVRCMASEIACDGWLEPKSWSAARPHLEVMTSIGPDKILRVEVGPWLEFDDKNSGKTVDGRADFGRLHEKKRPERIEAMRFDLGCIGAPPGIDDSALETNAMSLQRQAVFKLYERTVRNLAGRFTCRIRSGLVCFGQSNELAIRESSSGDAVQFANLLSDASSAWHVTLPKLCERLGVRADEALALFRSRLVGLPVEGQAKTLMEFCGRKVSRGTDLSLTTQLARALGAVCGLGGKVPLTAGNEEARGVLESLAREGTQGLWEALLNDYGLDEDDAWAVIREAHPDLYGRLERPARRWRVEIEGVERGDCIPWETHAEMERRMVEQLRVEAAIAAKRQDVQLRRVAASMGMEPRGLRSWGEAHARQVALWVDEMAATKGRKKK